MNNISWSDTYPPYLDFNGFTIHEVFASHFTQNADKCDL